MTIGHSCRMSRTITVRVSEDRVARIDPLVADAAHPSRASVIIEAIDRLVAQLESERIGREIVEGYERIPQTAEELDWADWTAPEELAAGKNVNEARSLPAGRELFTGRTSSIESASSGPSHAPCLRGTCARRRLPLTTRGEPMCRNIRTLHNFEPSATDDEIRAAALQYVRKVSGATKPSKANEAVFARAVDEIAHITAHLLDDLVTHAPPRDRDVEAAKARARAEKRYGAAA
jgi:Arc/MetJ-type ribon-helix-helix transcriptional regulator